MINTSTSGQQVWVATGIYKPTNLVNNAAINFNLNDRANTFTLKSGVRVFGGFIGNETLLNDRDFNVYITILSGEIGAAGIADNCFHVIAIDSSLSNTILDGFTIRDGNADSNSIFLATASGNNCGAGIYIKGSGTLLTIQNCTFTRNSALNGGGAYLNNATAKFTNCNFNFNESTLGGGIYNEFSNPIIVNCDFSSNITINNGGGIYNFNSSPNVTNCNFSSNTAGFLGGGMRNFDMSSPIITNCIFSQNTAGTSGGGLHNERSCSPSVINCIFTTNSASQFGGGMGNINSSSTIQNCTFYDNLAVNTGGGIHSTGTGACVIKNTIIWGNTGGGLQGISKSNGSIINASFSNIQNNTPGIGMISINPNFVNSTNPIGPDNIWRTNDDGLQLNCVSPSKDKGNNSGVSAQDIIGNPRIINITVDMGAYELYSLSRIYVNQAATGLNNGTSWLNAYTNLQTAINNATCTPVDVWVAKGTYKPTHLLKSNTINGNLNDRNNTFTLKSNVNIYGGFLGNENLLSARNYLTNNTILSGDLGIALNDVDNCFHVVAVDSPTATTILDGFTVRDGTANGSGNFLGVVNGLRFGAGIFLLGGANNFKLQNCNLLLNIAVQGGGMFANNSSPIISNCTFISNRANSGGGGLLNDSSAPIISNCTFNFNGNGSSGGAGMRNINSSPNITNCTFYSNNTISSGGAIYNAGTGTRTIKNTIIWGNSAFIDPGIFNSGAGITNVTYSNVQTTGVYPGIGNINSDPLFVSTSNLIGPDNIWRTNDDGLQLSCGSPSKNTGNNAGVSSLDIIGNQRIIDNTVDMGAYELNSISRIYVNQAATGLNNGTSWTNAYTNLQTAINNTTCTPVDIWVAKGIYKPTHLVNTIVINSNLNDRANTFTVKSGVSIYGGFNGNENLKSERDYLMNSTVLSGDLGSTSNNDNSYHVLVVQAPTTITILDGFTVRDGNANVAGTFLGKTNGNFSGGGIFTVDGSNNFNLQNCNLTSNYAGFGGGIYINNSSLIIVNCTISSNVTNSQGAGMFNQSSSPSISSCSFASNVSGNAGGGMINFNSFPKIINCTFSLNTASNAGGGMLNDNTSVPIINNCTFYANLATNVGGGIFNNSLTPCIINNTIIWANIGGGTQGIAGPAAVTFSNVQGVGVYAGVGNINIDPNFVNTSNLIGSDNIWRTNDDGLQLSCGSPSKNTATTIATITSDILNVTRPQGNAYDMGAYERGPVTPSINTTYTAGAWTPSTPNSLNTSIVFNDNFTSLSTDAFVGCECKVNPGKAITLVSGASMILNDGITVDNVNPLTKMTFENNAHLIQINPGAVNSGKITFKRNAQPMFKDDYTYWNSPVTLSSNFALSNLTDTASIYSWTPTILASAGNWNAELTTDFMNPTKGYIAAAPSSFNTSGTALTKTVSFFGIPNNGDINVPISRGSNANIGMFINGSLTAVTDNDDEWNLIGNPYPSPIDALAFLNDNVSVLKGTIYFWSHHTLPSISNPDPFYSVALSNYKASDYAKLNSLGGVAAYLGGQIPSQYIATGQSFFAQGIPSSGNAIFKNTQRFLTNSASFFRQNNTDLNRVWLNMETAAGVFSQILVGYHPDATLGLDSNYDGVNLSVNSDFFYSIISDNKLAIQGRPAPFNADDIVPLGIKSSGQNNFRISIDHFDLSFNNQDIFLKDNLLNITHNLKTSAYLFSSGAGDFDDRFELVYRDTALSTVNDNNANFNLFVYKKNNVIEVNSGNAIMSNVKIYDIQGRLLLDKNNINASLVELYIGGINQVVLIKTTLIEGQVITKKLVN